MLETKKNPVHSQNSSVPGSSTEFSAFALQVRPSSCAGGAALEAHASGSAVVLLFWAVSLMSTCRTNPRDVLITRQMSSTRRELMQTSADTLFRHTAGTGATREVPVASS